MGINVNLRLGTAGVESAPDASPASTRRKVGWVKEAAGGRYDDLELNTLVGFAMITDDGRSIAESMAPAFGIDPADALHVPLALDRHPRRDGRGARVAPGRVHNLVLLDRGRLLGDPRPRGRPPGRHAEPGRAWRLTGDRRPSPPGRAAGHYRRLAGHRIFVVDRPATTDLGREPLLVLHGFPTSSFDFHLVADELAQGRRLILVDFPGYGLSEKPDLPWTIDLAADTVAALTAELGLDRAVTVDP